MTIQITTVKIAADPANGIPKNELRITSPYNPTVVTEFKSRGGVWDKDTKEWVFTGSGVANGNEAVAKLFGVSTETVTTTVGKADSGTKYLSNKAAADLGLPLPRPEFADKPEACGFTQVTPPKLGWEEHGNIATVGGYLLASRQARDYSVKCHETLVRGQFDKSGGSAKSPRVDCHDDILFELEVRRDFAVNNNLPFRELDQPVVQPAEAARVPNAAWCYPPHIDDTWRLCDTAYNAWTGTIENHAGDEILDLTDWAILDFNAAFNFAKTTVTNYNAARFAIKLGDY